MHSVWSQPVFVPQRRPAQSSILEADADTLPECRQLWARWPYRTTPAFWYTTEGGFRGKSRYVVHGTGALFEWEQTFGNSILAALAGDSLSNAWQPERPIVRSQACTIR